MSKSPAFQLYAENFLSGTADMTAEEVGAYIRLLCHQWHKGGLVDDDKKLMQLTGAKKKALAEVKSKFKKGEDGRLRNDRLERARNEQKEYRERQKHNGAKGGRPKKPTETQTKPTENPVVISGETQTKPLQSSSASSTSEIPLNTEKGAKHFEKMLEFYSLPYSEQMEGFRKDFNEADYIKFGGILRNLNRDFPELKNTFQVCMNIREWIDRLDRKGYAAIKDSVEKVLALNNGHTAVMSLRIKQFLQGLNSKTLTQ